MNPTALAAQVRAIGREINLDTLNATRELYTPLHPVAPFAGVAIRRDERYGEHDRRRLDLFLPAEGAGGLRPALVFIHGGGFVRGDKYAPGSPFYDNVGVWAVRNGLIGINMTHRLAPEFQWPSVIHDVAEAIAWVKRHGREYGLDTDRIYLMGQSAGAAHAASYIAHTRIYAPAAHGLAGAIFLSGLYNLETLAADEMTASYFGADRTLHRERSPLPGLLATHIPCLIALAEREPPVFERQALELLTALHERDRRLTPFVHLPGQNHLSAILNLGLPDDRLGPAILDFIHSQKES